MMKPQGNKHLFLLLCACLPLLLQAQQFRYQCLTDTVRQTGFYSIPITPEMSAHMQIDFKDVRIWDDKKQQVPYIIRTSKPELLNKNFIPFPIVENSLDDSGRSVIVVEKPVNHPIEGVSLVIKNAAVSRYTDISGSNDRQNWFTISEQRLIGESYETIADSSTQNILFPTSDYRYLRLKIFNGKKDPLNIKSIGQFVYLSTDYNSTTWRVNNPKPDVLQTDSSNGISYIKVLQQQPFHTNQIHFKVDGPKYFSRAVSILIPEIIRNKKQTYFNEITDFTISQNATLDIAVPAFKADEFYFTITNGDNPPLKIKSVTTIQEIRMLRTWLEAGKQYIIMMDAIDATTPNYDLQQFQDSIPSVVPTLSVGKTQPVLIVTEPDKKDAFPQKWLWLIMFGAVAILGLLTWRLTGEMRKK